jgi:hypothetical protein
MFGRKVHEFASRTALASKDPFFAQAPTDHIYRLSGIYFERGCNFVVISTRKLGHEIQHSFPIVFQGVLLV